MFRSQCWFTFYFILHLNYIEPLLNDVKQLLIAAIMPSREGRVPLEGPFVRDTSQDHKSSGKCPPGFPLTTSGILWYEPIVQISRNQNIMVPVVLVIFLVLTGDSSSSSNSQYKVFIQEDE
ncbi:hypothetical protein Salat_2576300 [Sesamum alatum]|uniref:Uncharacterized protein n=1 Tax=Sesamum alatum TaxID=300844 RepID=A0AAE2CA44_9LAMI|nr:hypothetical protein Salat_2576300 [Sesamum alatum]